MSANLRSCWQNCFLPDDESVLEDKELAAIDATEDSLAPLDDGAVRIRWLITCFESCYHEADKQAELIIKAIGSGRAPVESGERPPRRKAELQNSRDILQAWCEDRFAEVKDRDIGGIPADKLISFIGNRTPLKVWQVQRMVEQVTFALDPSQPYHNMALNVGPDGQPLDELNQHYNNHLDFLAQTTDIVINDTVNDRKTQISLAIAIDRLQPCNWNFVNNLIIILKAIGGDLHPDNSFACCERNVLLSPLSDRLRVISNTLKVFWQNGQANNNVDDNIMADLGAKTPVKCWLAASLDKTVRSQLEPENVKRMFEWVEKLIK